MLIQNAKLRGREGLFDVLIAGKIIQKVAPSGQLSHQDAIDAGGRLVMPQFVDSHVHLGNSYTNGVTRHVYPDLVYEPDSLSLAEEEEIIYQRARQAALDEIANGVGYIRSHVDAVDPNLIAVKALIRLREDLKDVCKIQLCTFPYAGIYTSESGPKILEQAVDLGVDVIGLFTDLEHTPADAEHAVRFAMDLAQRREKMVDIHCDAFDGAFGRFSEYIASETIKRGMQGRVCTAYASASGQYNQLYLQRKVIPLLKRAEMSFTFVIGTFLEEQHRYPNPGSNGLPAVREYVEAGINIAFGQDGHLDYFYPSGSGNMLRVLDLALHVSDLQKDPIFDRCLDFISYNGAKAMGIDGYGVDEGDSASLIVLDAGNDYEAVYRDSAVLWSIHEGKLAVQTKPKESLICF